MFSKLLNSPKAVKGLEIISCVFSVAGMIGSAIASKRTNELTLQKLVAENVNKK